MQQAIDFAREKRCDSFVAVGGGSVMDTTKVAERERMREREGEREREKEREGGERDKHCPI